MEEDVKRKSAVAVVPRMLLTATGSLRPHALAA
jgi:hypothetical protein